MNRLGHFPNGCGSPMDRQSHLPKASRSRMLSVPSSCRMVALGDTDPLEWHRFHISSFPHSTAFQIVFRLQWIATATFKMPPVQEWRRRLSAVVWSHWATMTHCIATDFIFPLEPTRTLSKWSCASNGSLQPPSKSFPVKNGVGALQLSYGRTGRR